MSSIFGYFYEGVAESSRRLLLGDYFDSIGVPRWNDHFYL
jgi:hypothetical protein